MTEVPDGFVFSSDSSRMDHERIHHWLSTGAYWALGRPRETQDAAIAGSRSYGIFRDTGEQVAYARAVTDGVTFAWVCDVFVDDAVRGLRLGEALVAGVCAELDELRIKRILLVTGNAHGLYDKFGFRTVEPAENWMVRIRADQTAAD
ncbi:GNAT family N-acetyltransferase [Marmoricola sp. RAF53]|uniref:GNAT family N-acetyltransferase n=1 Tax=Marmoricola sp. RAF53 TaxID=3233059 RepID=UPI003F97FC4B